MNTALKIYSSSTYDKVLNFESERNSNIRKFQENDTEQYQRKALICLSASELDPDEQIVLTVLSYLLFIASIFLIVTFLVYLVIPELRNIHGVTVMCYCASLAATFITLGIIQLKNDFDRSSCIVLGNYLTKFKVEINLTFGFTGIFTHFFFLSSFTWLNVLSFDIWWTLG
jgi:G protein-coupled receptor Mth (Methuselah protein)